MSGPRPMAVEYQTAEEAPVRYGRKALGTCLLSVITGETLAYVPMVLQM